MRKRGVTALAAVVIVVATAALATSVGSAGTTRTAQQAKNCAFTLRIGDVLPFTGGLAAYGANLDRAVKVPGSSYFDPGKVAVLLLVLAEPHAALERSRPAADEHGAYPDALRLLQSLGDVWDVCDVEDYLFLRRWQRS